MMHNMDGAHGLMMLIMMILVVVPFWRISAKAGYPGALGLLILIPLVNLGFLYFLAFAQWPALRNRAHS